MAALALLLAAAIAVASTTISSLQHQNRRLAGFRPVRVTTTPKGARVAIVPINPDSNEANPDPAGIVRPADGTPLITELKPGNYLVEAVLPGTDGPDFVEVYRTVSDPDIMSASVADDNRQLGLEPETCLFRDITILPQTDLINKMVQIRIPEEYRQLNPLLPARLYVDASQATPAALKQDEKFKRFLSVTDKGDFCISYPRALQWAEINQTRLPSSAEYDAIIASIERGDAQSVQTGEPVKMNDLFDSYPEWSTTVLSVSRIGGNQAVRHLHEMHVLKGFTHSNKLSDIFAWIDGSLLADPETKLPRISIRGVRSATPRFVKPLKR
jgi:hypothetical protein